MIKIKRAIAATIIIVLAWALFFGIGGALAGGKVDVCHVPPGNPANAHTISIAEEAWNAGHSPHNSHDLDFLGACPTPTREPTSPPPPTETSTPSPTDGPEPTDQPTRDPTPAPVWEGEVCDAPAAEACDTCAQLERIADALERIALILEPEGGTE